jgi:hypothetical protein
MILAHASLMAQRKRFDAMMLGSGVGDKRFSRTRRMRCANANRAE